MSGEKLIAQVTLRLCEPRKGHLEARATDRKCSVSDIVRDLIDRDILECKTRFRLASSDRGRTPKGVEVDGAD